jgi:acyl-CoA dehydrogenase
MNEALQTFRAAVRSFIQTAFTPRQAHWREAGRPDAEAWIQAGERGILLTDVPQGYGGGGGTFAHQAVVLEELARAGVQFGSSIHSLVAQLILAYGSEPQKHAWLPRMAQGELVGAIAMTEPAAGTDLQGIQTTARRDGDCYVLNGSKTFITNAAHAGIVCLAARTDPVAGPRSISLIVVEPKDLLGYRVGSPLEKVGMHGQDTCELWFENVRVPAANLLGSVEGRGLSQLMETMSYERLAIGVAAVAAAEQAVVITTKYVKERTAFGKPLINLQNTRFKLAECTAEARIARVFLDHCIERFVAGRLDETTTAIAKYWLTDCEGRIVDECVQLHGGQGYMAAHPIARMWTDGRVHRIYAGTNEILKELIASSL